MQDIRKSDQILGAAALCIGAAWSVSPPLGLALFAIALARCAASLDVACGFRPARTLAWLLLACAARAVG
jgi:hypothetical protein